MNEKASPDSLLRVSYEQNKKEFSTDFGILVFNFFNVSIYLNVLNKQEK